MTKINKKLTSWLACDFGHKVKTNTDWKTFVANLESQEIGQLYQIVSIAQWDLDPDLSTVS